MDHKGQEFVASTQKKKKEKEKRQQFVDREGRTKERLLREKTTRYKSWSKTKSNTTTKNFGF